MFYLPLFPETRSCWTFFCVSEKPFVMYLKGFFPFISLFTKIFPLKEKFSKRDLFKNASSCHSKEVFTYSILCKILTKTQEHSRGKKAYLNFDVADDQTLSQFISFTNFWNNLQSFLCRIFNFCWYWKVFLIVYLLAMI